MSEPPASDSAPPFSERQFYLREFSGRTLGFALPPPPPANLAPLRPVFDALHKAGARGLVLAPGDALLEPLDLGAALPSASARWEASIWRALRDRGRAALSLPGGDAFAPACRAAARALGLGKLVWVDRQGGLLDPRGVRVSFLDREQLNALLARDSGEASARVALWREVAALLDAGVSAVNVCDLGGVDAELFTYAGSGTLFTRERYVHVRRLGVDDYDAAHDLVRRGVAEGYLAPRTPDEIDTVLASGFGAFVEETHLAGIGALLEYPEQGAGELVSLYTLTRFLGEGIGGYLVGFACERAARRGLGYVFACTASERVGTFFVREGFREVGQAEVPAAKWHDYDTERRARVRCYRREVTASPRGDAGGGL